MRVGGVLLAVAVAVVLAAGVVLGGALAAATPAGTGRWLADWSRSAGFGGTAAIVAASIAYRAAQSSGRRQQWVDRKVQWWARAQWALERVLSDDPRTQAIGLDMLEALGRSEWAEEHEGDLVDAALTQRLERGGPEGRRDRAGCPEDGGRRSPRSPPESTEEVCR